MIKDVESESPAARSLARFRAIVEEYRRRGAPRLPTIEEFAFDAGVAPTTALRALNVLRRERLIEAVRGKGYWLAGSAGESAHHSQGVPALRAKWERVAAHIESAIASGTPAPGATLPRLKELSARYGANYRTLRKALNALCATRQLVPHGRTYRVPGLRAKGGRSTVVLFCAGDPRAGMHAVTPRTRDIIRSLEESCQQAELRLAVFAHDLASQSVQRDFERLGKVWNRSADRDSAIGHVVLAARLTAPVLRQIVGLLRPQGRPIAVLDETGVAAGVFDGSPARLVRIFPMSYTLSAGKAVGRFVARLGHRRVAFISASAGRLWSDNRLSGLQQIVCAPAVGGAVLPCVVDGAGRPYSDRAGEMRARGALAQLLQSELGGRKPTDSAQESVWTAFVPAVEAEQHGHLLTPLFEQALADRAVTAWVTGSDAVAVRAMEFLKNTRKRVPRDLSIISFDDTMEAFTHDITSYNFNCRGCASAMLRHLTGVDSSGRASKPSALEVEGYVVERASTARLRSVRGATVTPT